MHSQLLVGPREGMRHPWTLPLGLLPYYIVKCAMCGAVISYILASCRRIVGEELESRAYKRGGAAPSFPLSMAHLLLPS